MDFENRIVSPEYNYSDEDNEITLRPKSLDEYIGQDKRVFGYIAELMLDVYIDANKLKYKEFRFACMDKHYIWNMFKGYIKSKFKKNK